MRRRPVIADLFYAGLVPLVLACGLAGPPFQKYLITSTLIVLAIAPIAAFSVLSNLYGKMLLLHRYDRRWFSWDSVSLVIGLSLRALAAPFIWTIVGLVLVGLVRDGISDGLFRMICFALRLRRSCFC